MYSQLKFPTRLYIKKCKDLYYFGKTIKDDVYSYCGSGKIWTNHIKKYGKNNVQTLWVSDWYYTTLIIEVALHFSIENKIDTSPRWANIILENGINGGGDCSQMCTPKVRNKVKNTCVEKYGYEYTCIIPEIKERRKKTIIQKYKVDIPGQIMSTPDSIIKRNDTNLKLYGNKCAANKDGNLKSKETQQNQLNRSIVKIIKCIALFSNIRLIPGWYYMSNIELDLLLVRVLLNPINRISKTKRDAFICRYQVKILIMINKLNKLYLGQNWFQIDDIKLNSLYEEIISLYPKEFYIARQSFALMNSVKF